MNKTRLIFFFFYIIYNFNGYSQSYKSGKITYTVEIVDIYESAGNNISKKSKKFSKLVSIAPTLDCILNFSDRESSFTKEKKIKQKESVAEIISGKGTYYTNLTQLEHNIFNILKANYLPQWYNTYFLLGLGKSLILQRV